MSAIKLPKSSGPVEVIYPQAAVPTALTPALSWGAWPAWSVVGGGNTVNGTVFVGMIVGWAGAFSAATVNTSFPTQIEFSSGAAGSEALLATVGFSFDLNFIFAATSQCIFQRGEFIPFTPVYVPASTPLSLRSVTGSASQPSLYVYLVGYEITSGFAPEKSGDLIDRYLRGQMRSSATSGGLIYPTDAAGISVPSSDGVGTWGTHYGAWTDIIAAGAIAKRYAITGWECARNTSLATANFAVQGQIGIGATPSAVAGIAPISAGLGFANPMSGLYMLPRPILCGAGTRAAVRFRASAITARNVPVHLLIEVLS